MLSIILLKVPRRKEMIGYKYRIYPTTTQKEFFERQFGCCRFVYNQLLSKSIENYQNDKTAKLLSNYAWLKKDYGWLKEADSLGLVYAGQNLKQAYQNFFREKKVFQNSIPNTQAEPHIKLVAKL